MNKILIIELKPNLVVCDVHMPVMNCYQVLSAVNNEIEAFGSTTIEHTYTSVVASEDSRQCYYRLKMVDDNGEFEYTDLIASKGCGKSDELIKTIVQESGIMTIHSNEEESIQIVNQVGQNVTETGTENNSVSVNTLNLSSGIYFVIAQNKSGLLESKMVFINR